MGPEEYANIPRKKHIDVSDINSRVCHPSARHCAHCCVISLQDFLTAHLWCRDGNEMLPKALQLSLGWGWGSEQTSAWPEVGSALLASAVPALGKPLWLTPVVREHPGFFGLSVTTFMQFPVLAISPPPGPFLVCPLPLLGPGLAPFSPDLLRSFLVRSL